uniref:G_PROTEIN_RECEP_F1_2 domain-containing protein n=1 Tax=Steinernema glaseri TaxID=37863 RepID=A0A1I7Y3R7_9BILA
MRTVSYFILNELGWNFLGNLMYTLGHPLPMMPIMCFRIDGVMANLLKTEFQRSMYFTAIVITAINCCLGFVITFFYRYVTLAFQDTTNRIPKSWAFLSCVIFHLITSFVVAVLFNSAWLPTSEYPEGELPEDTRNLCCYHPEGVKLTTIVYFFYAAFGTSGVFLTLLGGLCVRELWIKRSAMSKTTLLLQKEIVKNLLIVTGSALFFASLPLVVAVFFIYNSKLPNARTIVSGLLLIILNFGTFYAILILTLFKSYRKAVYGVASLVYKAFRKALSMRHSSKVIPSNVIAHRGVYVKSS